MDTFIDSFDLAFFYPFFIIAATIFVMRMMPRLMAGVPFVEPKMVHDLMSQGEDVIVIDVRSPEEFTGKLGHVPGAVNLQGGDVNKRLTDAGGQLNELKNEKVFVTCRTHNRSPRTARILKKAGFTNIAIVKGGMVSWNKEGLPVEGQG
ncbi:MAG: rhodanese-like domain-containing protein [Alphaproteobacteria bacterium]